MDQYEAQLLAVEQAIQEVPEGSERQELLALKDNLMELIALTTNESSCEEGKDELDQEMLRFMTEIEEISPQRQEDMEKSKDKLEKMIGEKCSAPHKHTWGAIVYHNAIICGIDDEVSIIGGNVDENVRILFTNPTHREMLPCSYYLEGDCRFDNQTCHYSHGEMVSVKSLRAYAEPDFSKLSRNCIVLAKMEDRLWHRGRVLCANYVEKSCRVRLDSGNNKEREQDFKFEDLLPILQDEEDMSDDSDSELDSYSSISAEDTNSISNTFSYELSQPLGDWEKHTRGIGSKLMAKMGWDGTGLGPNGHGIITPVTAQVLPPGRSLDHLRESINGDRDLISVENKLRKEQKKQEAINSKAYEREIKRTDVFSFINDTILATPTPTTASKPSLQSQTLKSLNVESVKVADDIRRKEREIAEIQKSIKRNVKGSSEICNRLKEKLHAKTTELNLLQKEQKSVFNEQASRKTKEKLCVF